MSEAFIKGFIKKASCFNISEAEALCLLKKANIINTLYPNTKDSLFDTAFEAPKWLDKINPTAAEVAVIGKHLMSAGIAPGLVGAGVGGLGGALLSTDRKKGATKGALAGAAIGFGSGLYHDAHNLGDNTRTELRSDQLRMLQDITDARNANANRSWLFRQNPDMYNQALERVNNNIRELNGTPWYQFFWPPAIDNKLK